MKTLALLAVTLLGFSSPAPAFEIEGVRALEERDDGSLLAESQGRQFELRPIIVQRAENGGQGGSSEDIWFYPYAGAGFDSAQRVNGRAGVGVYFGDSLKFIAIDDSLGVDGNKTTLGAGVGSQGILLGPGGGVAAMAALRGVVYRPFTNAPGGGFGANKQDLYTGAELEVGVLIFRFSVGYLKKLVGDGPGKKQGKTFSASLVFGFGPY